MNLDATTIGDMKKLQSMMTGGQHTEPLAETGATVIAVLDRGWVVVGKYAQQGTRCELNNASVIRIWGTKNGLGEIAVDGPTEKTVLDKVGSWRFDVRTSVGILQCDAEKWGL